MENDKSRNIVNKHGLIVEILCENLSWEDACNKEKDLIILYGRLDKNKTPLIIYSNYVKK